MKKSQQLVSNLYSAFWSLYGRYAWDDQHEPARVSDPPECIVDIVQKRRRNPNEWILDAGCGTGNYAIALAKAGFYVMGTDFAAGMLARAYGDRFHNSPKWTVPQAQHMPSAAGFETVSLDVGYFVLNPKCQYNRPARLSSTVHLPGASNRPHGGEMSRNPYDYQNRKDIRPISWEEFHGICKGLAEAVFRFRPDQFHPEYAKALAQQGLEPEPSLLINTPAVKIAKG